MRFLITGSTLLVVFAVLATAEEWSWGKDKSADIKDQTKPAVAIETATNTATDRESKSIDSYSELNDDNSGSQEEGGASVAGLSGNETDTQPRHVIKDRLCGLGLMEVFIINTYSGAHGRGRSIFRSRKRSVRLVT